VVSGHRYQGEPGEWEQDDDYEGERFLTEEDPCWLLELVAVTVEATDCGEEAASGTACRHYQGIADFDQARARASREAPLATEIARSRRPGSDALPR
jgi:hypothetical protein